MDAASRTGVDDIREIIDGVRYKPVGARYKVYIIDEVHMLSRNAFNALLKTLEEPPENVKFIFATTEIRKVPVTVLSRCQRFDLRRIKSDDLVKLFSVICEKEGVESEEEPLQLISRIADGSVRDGLSLLDQAMALAAGRITTSIVQAMLGLSNRVEVFDLFEEIMAGNLPEALSRVANMSQLGVDPLLIAQDLLETTHLITKFKVAPDAAGYVVTDLEKERGTDLAARLPMAQLGRCWQMLIKGINEIQQAPSSLPALEMVLIRLAYLSDSSDQNDIIERLNSNFKKKIPDGTYLEKTIEEPETVEGPEILGKKENHNELGPSNFQEIVDLFELKREGIIHAKLVANVRPVRVAPGLLEIMRASDLDESLVMRIMKLLSDWTGKPWKVSVVGDQGEKTIADQVLDKEIAVKKEVSNDPVVAAVLGHFPGAMIESVRPLAPYDLNFEIENFENINDD
jgi:DNA polymerase-3 subunit gamma/tau